MRLQSAHALAVACLALAACATPSTTAPVVPADAESLRIVVAPLNLAVRAPDELVGKGDPVWDELLGYFESADQQVSVLPPMSAELLWLMATHDLDVGDRTRALRVACSRFAQELAERADFDLLVLPSLVLRAGRLRGHYATWDGVHRPVPNGAVAMSNGMNDVMHGVEVRSVGLRGKVGAASLHVTVLRPDGSLAYEGLGGLDLVQEAAHQGTWDGRWVFVERESPFDERRHLREGVALALERPVTVPANAR
ncbi:MAG: hypothetical protein ACE5FL_04190 [Myxococcota bacterium]